MLFYKNFNHDKRPGTATDFFEVEKGFKGL